jgi:AraC-like DNA-binding protein
MARLAPDPRIVDLVEHHWIVSWDQPGEGPARREVLPDPCVNLVVEPAGRLLYGIGAGHGIRVLEERGTAIGTKFRPGGFSGLLPGPMSALNGRVLSLPEAFGAAGEDLDEALAGASDIPPVIAVVTSFLRAHRPARNEGRRLALEVAEAMRVIRPGISVNRLADEFGVSPRTLQRLFATHVGATPKQVLQRFRRQQAVDLLSEPGRPSPARIAAELGYSDQSRLTRDLRATLGPGACSPPPRDHNGSSL